MVVKQPIATRVLYCELPELLYLYVGFLKASSLNTVTSRDSGLDASPTAKHMLSLLSVESVNFPAGI